MSTNHERKLVKPEHPLMDFIQFTINHNDGMYPHLDNVTFDNDTDSLTRRAAYRQDHSLEQYIEVFTLTHMIQPSYLTDGIVKFRKSQWANIHMKKHQGTNGVAEWIFDYGPTLCEQTYHLLNKGLTIAELIKESAKVLGWNNKYHLTKTFKELYLLGYNIDPTKEIPTGSYATFATNWLKHSQTELLQIKELKDILKYPYNVEHNMCNWIKWKLQDKDTQKTRLNNTTLKNLKVAIKEPKSSHKRTINEYIST